MTDGKCLFLKYVTFSSFYDADCKDYRKRSKKYDVIRFGKEDAVSYGVLDLDLAVELRVQRLEFLGYHDDNIVHETPDDEVPCCSVPKTRGKPDEKRRQIYCHPFSDLLAQVLAGPLGKLEHRSADGDRIEDIIREPRAHGDVPAVPVFLNVFREVWEVKVLGDVDSEDPRDTYGYVDAAREVAVEVECVEQHQDEYEGSPVAIGIGCQCDNDRSEPVGNDHLLEKSPDDPGKSLRDVTFFELMAAEQRRREIVIAADRTLHQKREERDEQKELERVLLRLGLSPVDIDDVTAGLERVIRDRRRNDDVHRLYPRAFLQEGIDIGDNEIRVLCDA